MCQSFQVTNSVKCQRHSCLFFSCYILFYKKNPLVDLKLKLWPAIHARRGILNVADRSVASFTPSHYLQYYLSMTANAAAVPGLVISATTEYLTNNYHTQTVLEFYGRSTRLEAQSTPHGRKRNGKAASFSGYFFFLFSPLETRFARKTAETV